VGDYGGVGKVGGGMILSCATTTGDLFDVLYAHVQNIVLKKGDFVSRGDQIAEIGPYVSGTEHLHFGIREYGYVKNDKDLKCSEWAGYSNMGWQDRDCGFIDPIAFIKNHYPADLISKGDKSVVQNGEYVLDGSDYCPSATHVHKIVEGGDKMSDFWITEEVDKSSACKEVTAFNERVIQTMRDNDGTVSTEKLVGSSEKWYSRSALSSLLSKITSFFHKFIADARPSVVLAADPSIQQQFGLRRTGKVYQINGTDKQLVILTDGPGMNGDKAIDSNAYGESDLSEIFNPSTGNNVSGKRPDLVVTDLWTERSSGHVWDTIAWGSTVCMVAEVKNAGNADTPQDVKLSFYTSKGRKEDKDPRHAGYEMVKAKSLGKARTAKATVKHCINVSEDDYPSPYPGTFNFGVHVDSDNRVAESDEKNNYRGGQVFTLLENARLIVTSFQLSEMTPLDGDLVILTATITNVGTPFGSDKINIQYRIQGPEYGPDPVILGFDQIKRSNLRTNDVKTEDIAFVEPTVPGTYIVSVEVDYDHRTTQADRSGNTVTHTFTVPEPIGEGG
jgi:hypothetical protein